MFNRNTVVFGGIMQSYFGQVQGNRVIFKGGVGRAVEFWENIVVLGANTVEIRKKRQIQFSNQFKYSFLKSKYSST